MGDVKTIFIGENKSSRDLERANQNMPGRVTYEKTHHFIKNGDSLQRDDSDYAPSSGNNGSCAAYACLRENVLVDQGRVPLFT